MSGFGSKVLMRYRAYAAIGLAVFLLTWIGVLPIAMSVLSLPLLGAAFYGEKCPRCEASLALQKGNGFLKIRPSCSHCGEALR